MITNAVYTVIFTRNDKISPVLTSACRQKSSHEICHSASEFHSANDTYQKLMLSAVIISVLNLSLKRTVHQYQNHALCIDCMF